MAGQYPAVALQRLEVLFDKESSNPGVIAQLAFIHAKMTNYGDAIRYLGMAASIEPQNANHVYNMAVIADRAGSKNEAISYYERALEVDTLYGAGETVPRDSIFARLAQLR
jgi:tetratricopeptide (TPR) repeat protein